MEVVLPYFCLTVAGTEGWRHFNKTLIAWAMRKYKPLQKRKQKHLFFLKEYQKNSRICLRTGVQECKGGLPNGSGVSWEAHAPFYEGLAGQFRGSTHHQLHWVLDVPFRENDSRVRRDNASENFGVFRHVAVNALRNKKSCKKGIKAKRYKATLQPDYAQKALDGIFWAPMRLPWIKIALECSRNSTYHFLAEISSNGVVLPLSFAAFFTCFSLHISLTATCLHTLKFWRALSPDSRSFCWHLRCSHLLLSEVRT